MLTLSSRNDHFTKLLTNSIIIIILIRFLTHGVPSTQFNGHTCPGVIRKRIIRHHGVKFSELSPVESHEYFFFFFT